MFRINKTGGRSEGARYAVSLKNAVAGKLSSRTSEIAGFLKGDMAMKGITTTGNIGSVKGERGFTLVEVLIAMFIGVAIAAMLFYTLEQQSKTHTAETAKMEAQEKAVGLMDMVSRDIRMAGYLEQNDRMDTATSVILAFRADVDHNAPDSVIIKGLDTGKYVELITYEFQPPSKTMNDTSVHDWELPKHNGILWRTGEDGKRKKVAENLDNVKFSYYDAADKWISPLSVEASANPTYNKKWRDKICRIKLEITDSTTSFAAMQRQITTNPTKLAQLEANNALTLSRTIVRDIAPPNLCLDKLIECGAMEVTIGPTELKACDPPGSIAIYTVNTYQLDTNKNNVPSVKNSVLVNVNPPSSVWNDMAKTSLVGNGGDFTFASRASYSKTLYLDPNNTLGSGTKVGTYLALTTSWQPPEEGCGLRFVTKAVKIVSGNTYEIDWPDQDTTLYGCAAGAEDQCPDHRTYTFQLLDKCKNGVADTQMEFSILGNDSAGQFGSLGISNYGSENTTWYPDTPVRPARSDNNGEVQISYLAPRGGKLPYGSDLPVIIVGKVVDPVCTTCRQNEFPFVLHIKPCKGTKFVYAMDAAYACMNNHIPINVRILDKCDNLITGITDLKATVTKTSAWGPNEGISKYILPNPPVVGLYPGAAFVPMADSVAEPGLYRLFYNTRTDVADSNASSVSVLVDGGPEHYDADLKTDVPDIASGDPTRTFKFNLGACKCYIYATYYPEHFCTNNPGGLTFGCPEPASFMAVSGDQRAGINDWGTISGSSTPGQAQILTGNISLPDGPYWPSIPVDKIKYVFSSTATPIPYAWPFWMRNSTVRINDDITLHLEEKSSDGVLKCTSDFTTQVLCSNATLQLVKKNASGIYNPAVIYDPYNPAESVYIELKNCGKPAKDAAASIGVFLYSNSGDMERVVLTSNLPDHPGDMTYYRNAAGIKITALTFPVKGDHILEVAADDKIWTEYTDNTCSCTDFAYDEVNLTGFCVSAALYSGNGITGGTIPNFAGSSLRVHWGEGVVVGGVTTSVSGSNIPKKDRTVSVASTLAEYSGSAWKDRWFDLYAGGKIGGDSTINNQPYYSTGWSNLYQNITTDVLDCIMGKLNYDQIKAFAISNDVYFYALDNTNVRRLKSDGTSEDHPLATWLSSYNPGFMFVDLIGAPSLFNLTGEGIDAGTFDAYMPTFTMSAFAYQGFLYVAGNINVTGVGSKTTYTVNTPPLQDVAQVIFPTAGDGEMSDLPVNYDQSSSASQSVSLPVHVNGILYLKGYLASSVNVDVFGTVATERGYQGTGNPEVWYNYNNARGCGQKTCCQLVIHPQDLQITVGTSQQLTVSGGSGGQILWSFVDNFTDGTLTADGLYTPGIGLGGNIGLHDNIKVEQAGGGCFPGLMTSTVTCPTGINVTGDQLLWTTDPDTFYTVTGGNPPFRWTVDNTAVATINTTTGLLHPIAAGTVHVLATDKYGCSNSTPGLTVVVNPNPGCTVLYSDDFDGHILSVASPASFSGSWTNVLVSGTNDWAKGAPTGKCGDPSSDHTTGSTNVNVYGNNLGTGSGTGCYARSEINYLKSPMIIATGYENLTLSFWTSASVKSSGDILKAYVTCGSSPQGTLINHTGPYDDGGTWVNSTVTSLFRSYCDNSSSIYVYFYLTTDGITDTGHYGGWNVDDFSICGYAIH